MAGLTGVLACDPGWKGLAMTLWVPSLNYTSTQVFNLNKFSNKAYKTPTNTIPLLVDALVNDYWHSEPRLQFVNKIIIESQHKLNMQQLSWLIHMCLLTLLPKAKVEYISPLKCKRLFEVPLQENHHQNKKKMLEYVVEHQDELCAGNTVTTHDSADAIILLNTFLKDKNRKIAQNPFEELEPGSFPFCEMCERYKALYGLVKRGQNAGRYFATCTKCDHFVWCTEKPKIRVMEIEEPPPPRKKKKTFIQFEPPAP
jgi:hypothetical protein